MIFGKKIEVNRSLGAAIAHYLKKHEIKIIPSEVFKIVKRTRPKGNQMPLQPFGCLRVPSHSV